MPGGRPARVAAGGTRLGLTLWRKGCHPGLDPGSMLARIGGCRIKSGMTVIGGRLTRRDVVGVPALCANAQA